MRGAESAGDDIGEGGVNAADYVGAVASGGDGVFVRLDRGLQENRKHVA